MRVLCRIGWLLRLALPVGIVFAATALTASDRIKGVGKFNPQDEIVEVFSAIEDGKLDVKLIPKDSTTCRVLITNKTDKPLNVSMPDAFAGVPVLAQFQFPPGNFNNFNNRNNQNNAPQGLGIGNRFGNNFQGNRGNQFFNMQGVGNNLRRGPAANFAPFNVAPENVAQLKLTSVCLDHGKPNPRPKMAYEIKPIGEVIDKAEVGELCRMLGRGQVSQRAAQAAAWHLNNDMSWERLAGLRRTFAMGRITEPFFARAELAQAKKAAETAVELAREQKKPPESDSLSLR